MPKVAFRQSEYDRVDFIKTIEKRLIDIDMQKKTFYEKIGISARTYLNKAQKDSFTRPEILKIFEACRLPIEDRRRLMHC